MIGHWKKLLKIQSENVTEIIWVKGTSKMQFIDYEMVPELE